MPWELKLKSDVFFVPYYQFVLVTDLKDFTYNSSISDVLNVDNEVFKKRLLKVIGQRKIVNYVNEFVFKVKDFKEIDFLVEDFKNEFVQELVALNLE